MVGVSGDHSVDLHHLRREILVPLVREVARAEEHVEDSLCIHQYMSFVRLYSPVDLSFG
jgi:hypothetical protein